MSAVIKFSPDEEARIGVLVRRMSLHQEAARRWRGSLVRPNRLQELNDHVKAIHDDPTVTGRIRSIAGRTADLTDELTELLAVHNTSPSGSGQVLDTPDASTGTVGESSAVSLPPESAAPGGDQRKRSAQTGNPPGS